MPSMLRANIGLSPIQAFRDLNGHRQHLRTGHFLISFGRPLSQPGRFFVLQHLKPLSLLRTIVCLRVARGSSLAVSSTSLYSGRRRRSRTPTCHRTTVFKTACPPLGSAFFILAEGAGLEPALGFPNLGLASRCLTNSATPPILEPAGRSLTGGDSRRQRKVL